MEVIILEMIKVVDVRILKQGKIYFKSRYRTMEHQKGVLAKEMKYKKG